VIVAPGFSPDALTVLQKKKNLRVVKTLRRGEEASALEIRSVGADSYLLQERDQRKVQIGDLKAVTRRQPTEEEIKAMAFGWRIVKHVKSNAIVYAAADRTLGIGAGQMSRVDASRIAVRKAEDAGLSLQGSVVCSDAFFPFADGLIAAAKAGATAAIQPGGSVRDAEVIAAAEEHGVAMVFTGVRHFRH
jgi:phosphoribosylaminoimidazolecarboxamide formyltransferase/IMP cyclohydrolase